MSWLSRLLGGKSDASLKPQRLDYLNEALALERQGDFDAALTSYRLALRDLKSLGEAATRLGVHRNTVAYRVARLEALGDWDLSDPDLRFTLELAARIMQNAQG